MGKASKVKYELRDVNEMLDLISTLKNVADNKFFTLMAERDNFRRFGESFVDFFRMLSFTQVDHPLIVNKNPKAAIIVITIEGGFLAGFNNSIIRRAMRERDKLGPENVRFIGVGDKCADQLRKYTPDLKLYSNVESEGLYETAIQMKDYILDEVMKGQFGKVVLCYSWPKNFDVQKPRASKLLPAEDLVQKQDAFIDVFEKTIQESNPKEIIGFLVDLWITTRLYDALVATNIASAAAQSNFLEERVETMKKESKKTLMRYRKARRADIDKSLRETFVARSMVAN